MVNFYSFNIDFSMLLAKTLINYFECLNYKLFYYLPH